MDRSRKAAVIGAGPAGLMAAEVLLENNICVDIFEAKPTIGRKFLMAGKSGLNITHAEDLKLFLSKFSPKLDTIENSIKNFTPSMLREWMSELGVETFEGSSNRVFPREMKASPLLRKWHNRLSEQSLKTHLNHRWKGWSDNGKLLFCCPSGIYEHTSDAVILALGGASWPRLGSDANWLKLFEERRIAVKQFFPSNCGFSFDWSHVFLDRFAGLPIKSCSVTVDGITISGDLVITAYGMEGSPIYAHSEALQKQIKVNGYGLISLDLYPDKPVDELVTRLTTRNPKISLSNYLRKNGNLSPIKASLLREFLDDQSFKNPRILAKKIKNLSLKTQESQPIDRAISSGGGVKFTEVDEHLMLKAYPGIFVAGEMLDWNAPTGGYLINCCMALGRQAGAGANKWMQRISN
jgi:uncharacterized flavoprotein (TIGR03862 family)